MTDSKLRVCVVGAGAAGLSSARHLLAAGITPTVLERSKSLGGTWVYTEDIGYDDHGLPVHTSMYKSLRTNLPKEIMGFPDFPVPESQSSYISAKDLLSFLQLYSDTNDVTQHIKFNHYVKMIKPRGELWEVIYQDLNDDREFTDVFDAVMICNGHYNTPFIPKLNGIDKFTGDVLHSHDYRVPDIFAGKSVLVIGAGPSGMDIAVEISAVTRHVYLSHHLKDKPRSIFPDNLEQKPDVKSVDGQRVTFVDGSDETVDVIFYCTGYLYNFPFLDPSCGITVEENYVQPLYKHMINIEHPTMCLVGIPYYVCAFSMFDLQVRYFVKALKGDFKLPSKQQMYEACQADFEDRTKRGYTKRQAHMMGPDQGVYYDSISDEGGLEPLPAVMTTIHNDSSEKFLDEIVTFRNCIYKIINDNTFTEPYYKSLSDEANTPSLPSVLTAIRDESSDRFMHNIQNYRKDVYKIIDDSTYSITSNGRTEIFRSL